MKTLKQLLLDKAKGQSGGCWMIDFEPIISDAVREWLMQERPYPKPTGPAVQELLKELQE